MSGPMFDSRMIEGGVAILDFGSQYTQLIARRIREIGVYSQIVSFDIKPGELKKMKPGAIILSGGPANLTGGNGPECHNGILKTGIPILGICYGMQLMTSMLGGRLAKSVRREYGNASLTHKTGKVLFEGLPRRMNVWMSHGDRILEVPDGFDAIASSRNSPIAAMADDERRFYGVQFHPEVKHTANGRKLLENFVLKVAKCPLNWSMESLVKREIFRIRKEVGKSMVICGLSGGVDSSTLCILMDHAIGKQLVAIFVDNGLLRKGEAEMVMHNFRDRLGLNLKLVDASESFLKKLKGVTDPERKRKIIGREFIRIFEKEAKRYGKARFLGQGTLYPDVIESTSPFKGPSATIKSHHNVGGLPANMKLKLIEPFRFLFKDEVRAVARELCLPDELIGRHPFPGPGLAVRILGEITPERLDVLREADYIFIEELRRSGWYDKVWQAFCVLLPVKTVGVMGDERTYENVCAIRAVTSTDGMTADWARLPHRLVARISARIINEVKGINRIVLDVSQKPPSTIEWE